MRGRIRRINGAADLRTPAAAPCCAGVWHLASYQYKLLPVGPDTPEAADVNAPILVVSQFTLYANTVKGRRPSWNAAAPRAVAEPLLTAFADALRHLGARVETGVFGADMAVELVNEGPVTVLLEL